MGLATALLLTIVGQSAPNTWFGPATVSFGTAVTGNPYDTSANDAWVTFTKGSTSVRVPAYYDDRSWKATLIGPSAGDYRAELTVNGAQAGSAKVSLSQKLDAGFVRKGGRTGLELDNGKPYWPLGMNLGWMSSGHPPIPEFLTQMGASGMNWSRIWACHWDGKNPWWPDDKTVKLPLGEYWPKSLAQWDRIVKAAEKAGIRFQFVLFHHGQWSTTTNPNWSDNPWNKANGGFLADPTDFFTDQQAKKLSKDWIRYAIARWGYSPAIMGWELFNEVQWVDAVNKNRKAEVGVWHNEMADYVRSIDPHHLVLTSSEVSLPIWKNVDMMQPHGYPPRVLAMVLGAKVEGNKPYMFGEVGPGDFGGGRTTQTQAVRDGIYGGLLALHSGAAQFWTWDVVPRYNLLGEWKRARKIFDDSRVLGEVGLARTHLELDSKLGADLTFAPAGGWEPTRRFEYTLPQDIDKMTEFSSFHQGKGHPEMRPKPIRLMFRAPQAGKAVFRIGSISGTGGAFIARVNGKEVVRRDYAGGTTFIKVEEIEVPFSAGAVTIELDNDGSDWIQITRVVIPGIAPEVSATTVASRNLVFSRLEKATATGSARLALGNLPLRSGVASGQLIDLDTGKATSVSLTIRNGKATSRLPVTGRDSILWLRTKSK